jgi:hypothetical protein
VGAPIARLGVICGFHRIAFFDRIISTGKPYKKIYSKALFPFLSALRTPAVLKST